MSKFNIFDEDSWYPRPVNIDEIVTNRAIPSIGQMMGEIRELKKSLDNFAPILNSDYKLITGLSTEAKLQMEIAVEFPDDRLLLLLEPIKTVEDFWIRDNEYKRENWKNILPVLKKLRPFIANRAEFGSHFEKVRTDAMTNLAAVKVSGNAAWEAYRAVITQCEVYKSSCEHLTEQIAINSRTYHERLSQNVSDEEEDDDSVCAFCHDPVSECECGC